MLNLIAWLLSTAVDTPVPATLLREPVRVEIVAEGHVETPPDRFRASATLMVNAASFAVAQAAFDKRRAAVAREMAALGAVVSPRDDSPLLGFIGNERETEEGGTAAQTSLTLPDQYSFDVADRATADRVVAALTKDGGTNTKVTGLLSDDTVATDRARAAAISAAYSKAQRTATTLGMRVSALRRISDQAETPENYMAQLARHLGREQESASGNVVTRATLLVEFELTPAR